ncbi:MAG: CbtA family protein [Marivibrio sp.]|uniref:CbtA family protein n=1 Tax=Marivibrio sp. TaxID=2039719 RepID=UPI0032EEB0BC
MLKRIIAPALAAGVLVGALISGLQTITTTPILMEAETYESAAAPALDGFRIVLAHAEHDHGTGAIGAPWAPDAGIERLLYTVMANMVLATGFALLLTAAFAVYGGKVDGRRGLIWGSGGFLALTLAPAAGLPPELPGTFAADIVDRQIWWIGTALATAAGLALAVFAKEGAAKWPMILGGLALIALPHLIGAPHPGYAGGAPPPELAAEYAATSIAVSAVFWALLGWTAGTFWARGEAEAAAEDAARAGVR